MPNPKGNGNSLPFFLETEIKLTPCKASLTVNSVTTQTFSTAYGFTMVFVDTHHTRKKKFPLFKNWISICIKEHCPPLQ